MEKRWEDKTNIVRTLQATEKRQKDKTDTALNSRTEKCLQENTSKLQTYLSAEKHWAEKPIRFELTTEKRWEVMSNTLVANALQ